MSGSAPRAPHGTAHSRAHPLHCLHGAHSVPVAQSAHVFLKHLRSCNDLIPADCSVGLLSSTALLNICTPTHAFYHTACCWQLCWATLRQAASRCRRLHRASGSWHVSRLPTLALPACGAGCWWTRRCFQTPWSALAAQQQPPAPRRLTHRKAPRPSQTPKSALCPRQVSGGLQCNIGTLSSASQQGNALKLGILQGPA